MSVYTITFRSDIGDTHDRQWITVGYPTDQVPLTSHGNNYFRSPLRNDFSRRSAARIDKKLYPVTPAKMEEVYYLTFTALPAVLNILCHLELAILKLKTMGHKDQKCIWPGLNNHGPHKSVVYLYERLVYFYFIYIEYPGQK